MIPHLTDSPATSSPSGKPGNPERIFLAQLAAAMPATVDRESVKGILSDAKKQNLDPASLYQKAVDVRLPHWPKAPDYKELGQIPDATS